MPVVKTFRVRQRPEMAFERFTAELDAWWPKALTQAGEQTQAVRLEPGPGGRLVEVQPDGREVSTARVTAWQPPGQLVLDWQPPGWPAPTQVEILFVTQGAGTRVELEHAGWKALGDRARELEAQANAGWDTVLAAFVAYT